MAHGTSPTRSAAGARLTAVFAGGLPAVGLGLLPLGTVEAAEPAVKAGLRYTARWSFALFYSSRTVAGRAHAPFLLAALLAALSVEPWGRRRAVALTQAA